ncbi:MAG: ABC-type transport auxiliary lipoprotein family protein [Candidatus Latescibacterota bacterium]
MRRPHGGASRSARPRWARASVRLYAGAACLLLAVLPACSQLLGSVAQVEQKRRFTLVWEPIRGDVPGSERPYPVTVQVRPLSMAGAYDQTEIVTRRSPYELERERYRVWAQRPGEMLTDLVAEYLRAARLFARLASPDELLNERPDYVLTGAVDAIERFDSGDRWFARLALSLQLVRQQDGAVVWRGEIPQELKVEVYSPGMEHAVEAQSEILRRNMEQFVQQIDVALGPAGRTLRAPAGAAGAAADTMGQVGANGGRPEAPPPYYEFIPGKVAPE